MKKIIFILFALLASTGGIAEDNKKIPIEDFAKKSEFKDARISPDGKHVAFTYEDGQQVNLAIMDLEDRKIVMSFDSGEEREVAYFFWGNNERVVMLQQNITGWLDGEEKEAKLVAGNIDGTKRVQLWGFQRSGIRPISINESDPEKILIGKYHWSERDVKLHRMDIYKGEIYYNSDSPRPFGGDDAVIRSIDVDLNDVPRVAFEYDPKEEEDWDDDVSRVHLKNKNGDWQIIDLEKKRQRPPAISGVGFNLTNDKYYFLSNYDLDHDGVLGLFELDLNTQKIKLLFRNPDVDISSGVFGASGEVIGVYYEPGYPSYYYLDDPSVSDEVKFHKSLRASFKNQKVSMSNYSEDETLTVVNVSSDKNPGDFYLFNRETSKAKYIASSMPHIKPSQMSSVEPFIMQARDGLKMYGQMTIPSGKELKDLPMVVFPHGGPYGATDRWGFDWRAQLLASRGYLVLQLNYRGSGGYGQDFELKGNTEWGAKMQDDLTDATLWAVKQGYADKDRLCIHGISYGGYAAMHAAVKEPDLYQCSIPEAGLYEINLQWEKADSFRNNTRAGEIYKARSFGTEEGVLRERSPAYHADKVTAPIFLIHGEKDVRVPIENAYLMEKNLKEAGKDVQTYYKPDGHGFHVIEYRVESFEMIFDFLEEHIGK